MNKEKWAVFLKVLKGRLLIAASLFVVCFIAVNWVIPAVRKPSAIMTIHETAERQLIRLRKNFGAGDVYALKIRLRGQLNGAAMVRMFEGDNKDKIYREKMIGPGEIDGILHDGDWYADDCRIEYEPLSALQGGLKVEYKFSAKKKKESK